MRFDHPGPDNGLQGVAGCYAREFRISNPSSGPTPLQKEGAVAFPGAYLLCWRGDCSGAPPSPEVVCSNEWVDVDDPANPGQPKRELRCICNVIQYGGPSVGSNASFMQDLSNPQNTAADGMPLRFRSDKSGAQLWFHYFWEVGQEDPEDPPYIEIKHTDGTVARFSRVGALSANSSWDLWRLDWVRDPFDNQMTLRYDTQHGTLAEIEYPTGIEERWNWEPAWDDNWTGHHGIEVSYYFTDTSTELPEFRWYLVFADTPGRRHFGAQLTNFYAPASRYVPSPSSGLFSIADEVEAYVGTKLVWSGGRITEVQQFRQQTTQPVGPGTSIAAIPILTIAYDGNGRVATHTENQVGVTTSYVYDDASDLTHPAISGVTLRTTRTVDGDYHKTILEWDAANGRVHRKRIVPNAKVRTGDTAGPTEPDEVRIDYTFDQACVCQKPIQVDQYAIVSGQPTAARTTQYQYWPDSKLLKSVTMPNPATGTGQAAKVTYEYDYTTDAAGSVYWSAWRIAEERTPDGTWTYTYNTMNRAEPALHGTMVSRTVRKIQGVRVQTNAPTVTTSGNDVTETLVTNLPGSSYATYSGPQHGQPRGQPRTITDGDGVTTMLAYDGRGRLSAVLTPTKTTTVAHDDWGRLSQVIDNYNTAYAATFTIEQGPEFQTYRAYSSSSGVLMDLRQHYDRWGNLAVERRNNLASDGQAPHRYGQTGSARGWIRSEWHWDHFLLREHRVDRRPRDEGDGTPLSGATNALMQVTEYFYTPGGLPKETRTPNGSAVVSVFDGYGTLYSVKIRELAGDTQSAVHLVERQFVDAHLQPVVVVRGEGSEAQTTTITRNGAGAVTSVLEPTFAVPTGYTGAASGARHEFDRDQLGRVLQHRVVDPAQSTVLARRSFAHDQLYRVMKVTDDVLGFGSGSSVVVNYYTEGKATELTNVQFSNGVVQNYTYENGRLTDVADNHGGGSNIVNYSYHAGTDALARVRRIEHDGGGGSARTFETHYVVDPLGQVLQVKEGVSNQLVHAFAYDSLGRVDHYTDPIGKAQTFLLDALGRLVEHVRVGDSNATIVNRAEFTDWTGTAARTKVARFDGLDHPTVTHFDFAGRPFKVQHSGANPTDEPTLSTKNKPLWVYREYDSLFQVKAVYDGDGGQTNLAWDAGGRLIERDLVNRPASLSIYQVKDRLVRDRLGRVTQTVTWSASGSSLVANVIEQFDQDSIGRTHEERYLYAFGGSNVIQVQSGYSGGDPFRTTLKYLDNLSSSNAAPLHLEFAQDTIGRLAQVRWNRTPGSGSMLDLANYTWLGGKKRDRTLNYGPGALGETTFDWDGYERLSQIVDTVVLSSPPHTPGTRPLSKFDFEYDAASNLKKEWYDKVGGGKGDRFTYDGFHRLAHSFLGVDQATMNLSDSQLVDLGNPSVQRQFVQRLSYDLDEANNRAEVESQATPQGNTDTASYSLQQSGQPQGPSNRYAAVDDSELLYDDRGNLIFDGQRWFRYDYLNRLTEVFVLSAGLQAQTTSTSTSTSTLTSEVRYRITDRRAVEAAQQQIADEVRGDFGKLARLHRDPTFQARLRAQVLGGLERLSSGSQTLQSASLMAASLPAEDELTLVAVYSYDAFHRRVIRVVVGGETYLHAYDGWRECFEATKVGSETVQQKQFVWGAGLDEMLSYRRRDTGGFVDYFGHQSGQDSLVRLVDQAGNVAERYEWDAYGNTTVYNGSDQEVGPVSVIGNPYLWKTVRFDAEAGLYWMRHRHYSAVLGRFASKDPLGAWFDSENVGNPYCYVGNRPLTRIDAFGLQATVRVEANAFIGSRFGEWLDEPGGFLYEFKGDNRMPGESGTSRLQVWSIIVFEGNEMDSDSCKQEQRAGESHRRSVFGEDNLTAEVEIFPFKATWEGDRRIPRGRVQGGVAAAYPFAWIAPDIDIKYESTWTIHYVAENVPCGLRKWRLGYSIFLITDTFPDYEIKINGRMIHERASQHDGPGIWNLGGDNGQSHSKNGVVEVFEPIIAPGRPWAHIA